MKIATLESNQLESEVLQRIIVEAGHECIAFFTGQALIDALHYKKFDLLILEWHFPDMDGHAVIKAIRRGKSKNMMVMFLTHQISDADVAMGLKAGANDYATKPIAASDLIIRIHALSKIASHSILEKNKPVKRMPDLLGVGFYHFDLVSGIASIRGKAVDLQPKEFDIAVLLFFHAGELISREKIMNEIWRRTPRVTSRTLDAHMSRVRNKLQLRPDNNVMLSTVYTVGYRLDIL